jgi:hypothetical protein
VAIVETRFRAGQRLYQFFTLTYFALLAAQGIHEGELCGRQL